MFQCQRVSRILRLKRRFVVSVSASQSAEILCLKRRFVVSVSASQSAEILRLKRRFVRDHDSTQLYFMKQVLRRKQLSEVSGAVSRSFI